MRARIHNVTMDVNDPQKMAAFWVGLTGYKQEWVWEQYTGLSSPDGGPNILLQRVGEPREGKNRWHVDFFVEDLDAAVARAEELGGAAVTRITEGPVTWHVMTDPEGNEFCLTEAGGAD